LAFCVASARAHRSQAEPCLEMCPWRTVRSLPRTVGVSPAQDASLRADPNLLTSPTSARITSGLSRDGLLVPGKPPRHPLAMANLAYRSRYYSPPLPRWLYWTLIGAMAPFGARACDRIMARYNPPPAPTSQTGR
jgi:hypothetical protein